MASSFSYDSKSPTLKVFEAEEIDHNLALWESDMAIMFYISNCTYCNNLAPYWSRISSHLTRETLKIGIFNCELNTRNFKICEKLSIDHYPSLVFLGFGDFNQAKQRSISLERRFPNVVKYLADIYSDRLYYWIMMLSYISKIQRSWFHLKSFFGGQSWLGKVNEKLKSDIYKLNVEIEKQKDINLFKSLPMLKDPFPDLHRYKPDKVSSMNKLSIYFELTFI
jgi:hypothetical protein